MLRDAEMATRGPDPACADMPSGRDRGGGSLSGPITALVTPFRCGELDLRTFADAVVRQVEAGTRGLVVGGPTGEGPTLTGSDLVRLVEVARVSAAGRAAVIASLCASGTARVADAAAECEAAGADALLVWTPPYNKPTQAGVLRHFETVARAVRIPILAGDDVGRTRIEIGPGTAAGLAATDGIAGIVHASGAPPACHVPQDGLRHFCGADGQTLPFAMAGAAGTVSALANIAPSLCAESASACAADDWPRAIAIRIRLAPLVRALALEPDPGPHKYALSLLHPGFPADLRLPLVAVGPETAEAIRAALSSCGLADEGHGPPPAATGAR